MPELSSLKPSGLPSTAFQPLNPASYFDRHVTPLTPDTSAASELASQTAISTLVAKAVGDLPNLITTNLLKGGETRNKLAGQRVMGQVLGGTPLTTQQRGALADTKIDSGGASTMNPESPAEIAYKQALAGRANQLTINETPVVDPSVAGIPGVKLPPGARRTGGALGDQGTPAEPGISPGLVEPPLPSDQPGGVLAEPKTGALAPDNRPIWQTDTAVAKAMEEQGLSGDDLLNAKMNEAGNLIVANPDGTEREIPEKASTYLKAEIKKDLDAKEAATKLDSLTGKGALAEPQLISQTGNTIYYKIPGVGTFSKNVMSKPGEQNKPTMIAKEPGAATNGRYLDVTMKSLAESKYEPLPGESEADVLRHSQEKIVRDESIPINARKSFNAYDRTLRSDTRVKNYLKARHAAETISAAEAQPGLSAPAALAVVDSFVTAMRGGAATQGMLGAIKNANDILTDIKLKKNRYFGDITTNTMLTEESAKQIVDIVRGIEEAAKKDVNAMVEPDKKRWKRQDVPGGAVQDLFDSILAGTDLPAIDEPSAAPEAAAATEIAKHKAALEWASRPENKGTAEAQRIIDGLRKRGLIE